MVVVVLLEMVVVVLVLVLGGSIIVIVGVVTIGIDVAVLLFSSWLEDVCTSNICVRG